jgi:hypothetical protein
MIDRNIVNKVLVHTDLFQSWMDSKNLSFNVRLGVPIYGAKEMDLKLGSEFDNVDKTELLKYFTNLASAALIAVDAIYKQIESERSDDEKV